MKISKTILYIMHALQILFLNAYNAIIWKKSRFHGNYPKPLFNNNIKKLHYIFELFECEGGAKLRKRLDY